MEGDLGDEGVDYAKEQPPINRHDQRRQGEIRRPFEKDVSDDAILSPSPFYSRMLVAYKITPTNQQLVIKLAHRRKRRSPEAEFQLLDTC